MKHLLYCLFVTVLFASCDDFTTMTPEEPINGRLQDVMNMSSLQDRKLAYSLLDGSEKSAIWKSHISTEAARLSLNNEQKEIVAEVLSFISSTDFESNNWSETKEFQVIKKRLEGKFDLSAKTKLFANVGPEPQVVGGGGCSCAYASDFCGGSTSCSQISCTMQSGCGLFWAYTCNGICAVEQSS